jgi:UDP-N-acetylglucosamine 2-epimerase (non-hydrolysing)/GDP/UDP-N,N'-diacetylbacillosamine 2-epimerase (hydrolysing)
LNIDFSKPVLVVVQHAVLTEIAQVSSQIRATMEAVKNTGHSTIVIYPNVDAAGREIIAVIREYERLPQIHVFSNLSRKRFLSVLAYASALIGNSSAGILEAPSFKLPAINIGTRQKGRMRAVNVIDVKKFERDMIAEAIEQALVNDEYRSALSECINPYGDGYSSERICKILEEANLQQLREKMMTY